MDQNVILQQCEALFITLFVDDQEIPNFLLQERLAIMSELNDIFNQAPSIISDDRYWRYVKEGAYDFDAYCRKLAIQILQQNINKFQNSPEFESQLADVYQRFNMNKQQFEQLWSTFFEVYDTLDAFSSHLTKAIWERTEAFYAFLQQHHQQW